MRARLVQLEVHPGQPSLNTQNILSAIKTAQADKVSLLVFPEMAVPGYLLGDEWERPAFLRECETCNQQIIQAAIGMTVIFGSVAIDWQAKNEDGRPRKYNALFVAENGATVKHSKTGQGFFIKTLMPNYREFDDNRHFFDPRKLAYELGLSIDELIEPAHSTLGKLGGILCEDGWDEDYNLSPLSLLCQKGADLLINISSSPYTLNKNHKRNRVFSEHAKQYQKTLLYVNNVGLQDNGKTVFTFDGATCAYGATGTLLAEAPAFTQHVIDLNVTVGSVTSKTSAEVFDGKTSANTTSNTDIAHQFEAIIYGTRQFMERLGTPKVVVGVSGGIDSALVASIYRHILGPDNLLLVSMPGPFSSKTTRSLSQQLARNLDCYFAEMPIEDSVNLTERQLVTTEFKKENSAPRCLKASAFVMENIQARDRSSRILAACAAAFGAVFTCNANKSEMTVGYSTLYGDLGGYLANIADLWKGEVYAMSRFINEQVYQREVIPQGTLDIVPSAELSSAQNVDANQGDPLHYPYHDALFRSWVERWNRATPEDNLRWYCEGRLEQELGFDGNLDALFASPADFVNDLERWWKLYQGMAIAKRIQAPPVLAVKRRTFGFDHREAQLGPRFTQAYWGLKRALLGSA